MCDFEKLLKIIINIKLYNYKEVLFEKRMDPKPKFEQSYCILNIEFP